MVLACAAPLLPNIPRLPLGICREREGDSGVRVGATRFVFLSGDATWLPLPTTVNSQRSEFLCVPTQPVKLPVFVHRRPQRRV